MIQLLSHSVYWTSLLWLCFSSVKAAPPLWSLKLEALQSPVTSSRSVDSSLTSLPIASCTTFTFYIFFFLRRVLDLGLFSCGWESSGRLLQGRRRIWSIWNTKQKTRCQAINEASCIGTCMMHFLSFLCGRGSVELLMNQNESKEGFFFPLPPRSSGYILLTQIYSGDTHETGPAESIFEFPFTAN